MFDASLSAVQAVAEEPLGSRAYWLLNPEYYSEQNRAKKAHLETCISKLGFVSKALIKPEGVANFVEFRVTNVIDIPITGLVMQATGTMVERLDLDGRTLIEFDVLLPGATAIYERRVSGFQDYFPIETELHVAVWDVLNEHGTEVVEHIMWSHWPLVSSEEEFALAKDTFCNVNRG